MAHLLVRSGRYFAQWPRLAPHDKITLRSSRAGANFRPIKAIVMLELIVDLIISGDFDPASITERLKIVPSDSWRRGDLIPRTMVQRLSDGWCLKSGTSKDTSIAGQTNVQIHNHALQRTLTAHSADLIDRVILDLLVVRPSILGDGPFHQRYSRLLWQDTYHQSPYTHPQSAG